MEGNQLKETQLKQQAKAATKARARLRKVALAADVQDQQDMDVYTFCNIEEEEQKISVMAKRIHNGYAHYTHPKVKDDGIFEDISRGTDGKDAVGAS